MEFGEIKGFGAKRIEYLKNNGIETVSDLLTVFPYDYVDLACNKTPGQAIGTGKVAVFGTVKQTAVVKYIRKGLFLTTVKLTGKNGEDFECGWFNQKYIKKMFTVGKHFYMYGVMERFGKKLSMNNPTVIPEKSDMPSVYPLYKPLKKIPMSTMMSAIDIILDEVKAESFLGEQTLKKFGLMELNKAIRCLHRPPDLKSVNSARESIATENLSCNIALYKILKHTGSKRYGYSNNRERLNEFIDSLPFEFTKDQSRALNDIISDLHDTRKMNRLLQGDVGCGKTVVALAAMFYAAMSGYQSIIMCPTEILAKQHYDSAVKLFNDYNIRIVFLSSSLNSLQRKEALTDIESGHAKIIIGTHSLIQNDVVFFNPSLIITDEQQRFGVRQRGVLENKAPEADSLVMTATPIPRTLALTLYGDLRQSEIRTLPELKAKTETRLVPAKKFNDMLEYIENKADIGELTYMVCPRIDDDELVSVDKLYEILEKTRLKPYLGILHGRQTEYEKGEVMRKFMKKEIRVLIATSIIEVGIDVTDATTIAIFNAERYGLSQLHQLRGRVGRGSRDSFCFLFTDNYTEKTKERLDYFISCNDGFELAEYDFKSRSAGDFMGVRQHGDSLFSVIDKNLIDKAKSISEFLAEDDAFKRNIMDKTREGQILFIKNLTMN